VDAGDMSLRQVLPYPFIIATAPSSGDSSFVSS
jgi:hypothetical protein